MYSWSRGIPPLDYPVGMTNENNMNRLKDKTVIVTGSSRGIGKAIAQACSKEGAKVVVNYLSDKKEAEATVKEITAESGTAIAIKADVTKKRDVEKMVEKTIEEFGTIDCLVNNASAPLQLNKFTEIPWEDFHNHFEVQVHGSYNTMQAVLPKMIEKKNGVILNVASRTTLNPPSAGHSSYTTGKYGILGLTRAVAIEVAAHGVRVNAVSPGLVDTDLTKDFPQAFKDISVSNTPLGRMATVEDVAAAAVFLLSDESGFTTGTNFPVSGGKAMC